jgi:hypothetical protein
MFEAAWESMAREEEDRLWDRFYDQFRFHPSIERKNWPSIREPLPSVTLDLSGVCVADQRGVMTNMRDFVANVRDIDLTCASAFQRCTSPSGRLAVLDWQHPCYWFWPHRLDLDELRRTWELDPGITHEGAHYLSYPDMRRSAYPDGDYYIFLAEDLRFGTFGHPWEETLCLFGHELLDTGLRESLGLPVVRNDGRPVG